MSSNAQLELFPKKWYKKLTPAKLKDARQQLRAYSISKELDTGLSEQMQFFKQLYPSHQAMTLQLRAARRGELEVTPEVLRVWEESQLEQDEVLRQRLFILTIAAEKGWKIAGEVAFRKKGNMADKDLAKVLERDERKKRNGEAPVGKAKRSKGMGKTPRPAFGGAAWAQAPQAWGQQAQAPSMGNYGYQAGASAPSGAGSYQAYQPRTETRHCLMCRQQGHIMRNCPMRVIPAAQGAAPKLKEEEEFSEFREGAIHELEFRTFWKETLQSSDWVIKLLEEGYEIPFTQTPTPYREPNNKSVLNNEEVVRKMMREMLDQGIVKRVEGPSHCVSPLGLVTKELGDGSIKHRLVWDGSRHVNNFVQVPHVRLTHLERALEMTKKGDFQVVFDLVSAYHHIRIKPRQTKFLGAAYTEDDGTTVFVEFAVLPFGLASAVHAITKVFKPLIGYINTKGIRCSIFIDDGRILGESSTDIESARREVYKIVKNAGWAISQSKSDRANTGNTVKQYLGFIIDSTQMKVWAPEEKLEKVKKSILTVLKEKLVPVKTVASALGRIASLEISHGMVSRVATRSGYESVAWHTEQVGWKGSVPITQEIKQEFEFFLDNLQSSNGRLIKSDVTSIRLETILDRPVSKWKVIRSHPLTYRAIVSDSSSVKAFAYDLTGHKDRQLEMVFTEEQKAYSSTARELLALQFWLQDMLEKQEGQGQNLYWITDSMSATHCIEKGSRRHETQAIVFQIARLAQQLGLQITPVHLLRTDPRIEKADIGSKTANSDNWSIDFASFQDLDKEFHFEFDLFASKENAKKSKFASLYFQPEATATEAFSLNWADLGKLWVCPPISLLIATHDRILRSNCTGVICFPLWQTATFYGFFFGKNGKPKEPFRMVKQWHPFIFQHENAVNTPLRGFTPFPFVALSF